VAERAKGLWQRSDDIGEPADLRERRDLGGREQDPQRCQLATSTHVVQQVIGATPIVRA
jgi:hypothetical protein